MCNEKEFFEKVKGHIDEKDMPRLRAIIDDINEFNKNCNPFVEIYADFDNVGNDSEFDPYETYKIYIQAKEKDVRKKMEYPNESITTELSLNELDNCACALIEYQNEKNKIVDVIDQSLEEDNKRLTKLILEKEKEGCIVYKREDGIKYCKLDDFTKQPLDGQLYDINRLPEVIYTLQNEDSVKYYQPWINNIALINLCKYYYKKCGDLETKLRIAEEENLKSKIIG